MEFIRFSAKDIITTSGPEDELSKLANFKGEAVEDNTQKSTTKEYDGFSGWFTVQ